ncbi:chromate transporter [Abyssisolibacter fermentans]|uniref:chromate transporter n=1 Tax=Abyssisolibacter fermentans TaxID=1766203 RepID=UPI000830D01F|nr:chromate transporter [Abyssisolibacter fermentans]
MRLLEMFLIFFKIGGFTFGGGFAMIPLIERELVDNKGWANREDIVDILALCQSIPGSIAVNCATFIGYKIGGIKGAVSSIIGVTLPSFLIITLIAEFFTSFLHTKIVEAAFMGIRASVVALIITAVIKTAKVSIIDKTTAFIAIITTLLIVFISINPIWLIICGGLFGVVYLKYYKKI